MPFNNEEIENMIKTIQEEWNDIDTSHIGEAEIAKKISIANLKLKVADSMISFNKLDVLEAMLKSYKSVHP